MLVLLGSFCFLLVNMMATAQNIEIGAQFAMYDPGHFTAYTPANQTPAPSTLGTFHASAGKTSGTIPAYTAQITVNLAAEVIWTGGTFDVPAGWIFDAASSDPQNLTFYNSSDWTTEDPYFMIPVRAVAPRSDSAPIAQTQVMNIGGDWTDPDPSNNSTPTGVTVDAVLPVNLTNFNAVAEFSSVNLTWSTTMEANSNRFEIERSRNGKNWSNIGSVPSHQESNSLKNYIFNDKSPENGENLYRLKMVDKDNTFTYSSIRSVNIEGISKDLSVYPNPSSDFIRLRDAQNVTAVAIIDLHGKTVYQTASVSKGEISVKNLTSGMYSVRIETKDGGQSVQKLVVAR